MFRSITADRFVKRLWSQASLKRSRDDSPANGGSPPLFAEAVKITGACAIAQSVVSSQNINVEVSPDIGTLAN
ncbi:MAG: hypothetical protein JWP89_2240 [Schlesneria sp.]|nr:hypothetical protein [Schlesneria sp.]